MSVKERFLKYVTFSTASDENSNTFPSTEGQITFADFLVEELKSIGVTDAERDCNGYVYGHIAATSGFENCAKIGLISHMDTSPDASGENVKPQTVKFDGKNLPMIPDCYIGCDMIVSDRTTLLGADDKAGVAEIVAACERIIKSDINHGKICICFTPDEEIGCGADRFDFDRFDADYAYTVDGGELGAIEYENFNAASVKLKIAGLNTHPGSAKGKMRNAALYLNEFINMLPPAETPANTENKEGFYHINYINGDETNAELHMLIRDHSKSLFEKRKDFVKTTVEFLNKKYGENTFNLDITDSYYNMVEIIKDNMHIVNRAETTMKNCGVEPFLTAIRGGTDGARLSFEGLPCPNLSTGGLNFHSIYEAIPVEALYKMTDVIVNIISEN